MHRDPRGMVKERNITTTDPIPSEAKSLSNDPPPQKKGGTWKHENSGNSAEKSIQLQSVHEYRNKNQTKTRSENDSAHFESVPPGRRERPAKCQPV